MDRPDDAGAPVEPDRPAPPSGAAWDHPPTRKAMQRYLWNAPIWVVAGLAVLITALLVEIDSEARTDELARDGERASGIVVDVRRGRRGGGGSIDVRFPVGLTLVERTISTGLGAERYAVGDMVQVIYDPDDLTRVRTAQEDNDPAWLTAGLLVGLGFGALAAPGAVMVWYRARRGQRLLRASPWHRVRCRYLRHASKSPQILLELDDGTTRAVRGFTSALFWRPRTLRAATSAWVAGDLNERLLLVAPEGGRPVLEVRQAWLPSNQRRWEEAFERLPHVDAAAARGNGS